MSFPRTITSFSEGRRGLWPALMPNRSGMLQVSSIHQIYWEESGNPRGVPVLYLHGGPGGGCDPKHRRFYDPRRARIILFDQRGCGRSRPLASVEENTTWELVADIEALRQHLGISQWIVAGGSWGSTLALAYAQCHPERVHGLLLRGVFTFSDPEFDWFLKNGTRRLFPEIWADFVAPIPEQEHDDIVAAYYRRLVLDDPNLSPAQLERQRIHFAEHWSLYECRLASFHSDPSTAIACQRPEFALPFARLECHYLQHRGFLRHHEQLLEDMYKISSLPTFIVHGRYDVICPVENAWRVHKALPHSQLMITPGAGHSAFDSGNLSALIRSADELLNLIEYHQQRRLPKYG